MNSILKRNDFFVKEHRGILKASNNYDIFDAHTQEQLMYCREENLGGFTKLFRFTDYKTMTPFDLIVRDMNGSQVVRIRRGFSWFRSKVEVLDENNIVIGYFRQRLLTIGGKFDVLDANGSLLCTLRGKWHSWEFNFTDGNSQFASVSKKWAGIGREFFTSADNYVLSIDSIVGPNDSRRPLLLAAVMCIDFVLKEN